MVPLLLVIDLFSVVVIVAVSVVIIDMVEALIEVEAEVGVVFSNVLLILFKFSLFTCLSAMGFRAVVGWFSVVNAVDFP